MQVPEKARRFCPGRDRLSAPPRSARGVPHDDCSGDGDGINVSRPLPRGDAHTQHVLAVPREVTCWSLSSKGLRKASPSWPRPHPRRVHAQQAEERGWSCHLGGQSGGGGDAEGAGSLGVATQKYIVTSDFFAFIFLKTFLHGSTTCRSFRSQSQRPTLQKQSGAVLNDRNPRPDVYRQSAR